MKRWQYTVLLLVCLCVGMGMLLPLFDNKSLLEGWIVSKEYSPLVTGDDDWWIYPEPQPYQIFSPPQFNWSKAWPILLQHMRWALEGYNPNIGEWVYVNDSLDVQVTPTGDNSRKINLVFDAPAPITTDYRLTLAIDYKIRNYFEKIGAYAYNLTYEAWNQTFNVTFDFSDIAAIPGIIMTHGIKELGGEQYFWFRARKNAVPAGAHVEIDPSYFVSGGTGVSWSFSSRRLARTSDGELWAIFVEATANDIWVANSTDEGVTWTSMKIPDTDAYDSLFIASIAIDSNDIVHAVWSGKHAGDGTNYQIRHADSSDNFVTAYNATSVAKNHFYPSLAIDSNDKLHVTYEIAASGASNDDQVGYINSTDGITWSAEQILSNEPNAGDDAWIPVIVVNSTDALHIIYSIEDYGTYDQIAHIESTDSGLTWSNWDGDVLPAASASNQYYPTIAVDKNDYLQIEWNTQAGDIFHAYNDSTEWSSFNELGAGVVWFRYHSIATAYGNNSLYILGSQSTATPGYIGMFANYTGGSWETEKNIINAAGQDLKYPSAIHAYHPIVSGAQPNIPETGYACLYFNDTTDGLYYYASSDLTWQTGSEPENTAPNITGSPVVWNSTTRVEKSLNATGVDLFPTSFNVSINDSDGNLMNLSLYWNDAGTWKLINQSLNVSNGTQIFTNTSWVNLSGHQYNISFNLTDGTDWTNQSYYFNTSAAPSWQNIFSGYVTGGNITSALNIFSGYVTGGNNTVAQSIFSGYVTGGNSTSAQNIFSGYVTGGNVFTVRNWIQIFSGYVTGGNNTVAQNIFSGYVTGGNATLVWQSIFSGFVTGGNQSNYQSIFSGFVTGGNISKAWQNVFSGYVTGGNITPANLTITNPFPLNNSNIKSFTPVVRFTLTNEAGRSMNYSIFYGNSSANCTNLLSNASTLGNGTYSYIDYFTAVDFGTYYWRVYANDSSSHVNETFLYDITASSGGIPSGNGAAIAGGVIGLLGGLGGAILVIGEMRKKRRRGR